MKRTAYPPTVPGVLANRLPMKGCTAIIGLDAHDNKDLETPMYYDRAVRELKELKIERIDELRMLI